ncbi:hypothetical protein OMP38_03050 [Cohnella ginsengisoli]|uniref:Dynamin n=1 Tax=Cohnella ginsengisoli TaxID=425004 RepID=A0A9X4KDL6_9BACL|nr:hypothetical protein [Cohnella ginsengisoli]MDG0789940.1 hypothetical protein [Cohnella ginsengisoli]
MNHSLVLQSANSAQSLKKRFFSYELDDPALRQKFEASFTKLITKQLPALKRKQTREALATFKNRVISHQTNEIQKVSGVLHSREQAIEGYDKAMQQKEKRFREIDLLQEDLQCKISEAEKQNLAAMTAWEQKTINSDFVMGLIQKKGYDRKQAKNYLLSDLSDLYFAQMQTILKTSLAEFENDLTTFFNAVEQKIEDIDKHAAGVASIPFDFKGALSGGLAGATVLGGLGLWASTVGNLGGYILVAKGVGLLSTLGISVGGGAAATTFVAAIGGPITIAISIALGVFAFVSAIFGDGWKKRMAKDAASAVQKQNVIAHYQKAITTFWQNTQLEIRETVTTIKSTFDQHLSSLESIIKSGDSETARLRLKKLENCLQQFTSLPWNDDEE